MKFLFMLFGIPMILQIIMWMFIFRYYKKKGSYQHCGRASYMGY